MAKSNHIRNDSARQQVIKALDAYTRNHPDAKVSVRRRNPVSIRVRVVDPDFRGLDELQREDLVWRILDRLPDEARSQITFVLLFTPEEQQSRSILNEEFEHPTPSRF